MSLYIYIRENLNKGIIQFLEKHMSIYCFEAVEKINDVIKADTASVFKNPLSLAHCTTLKSYFQQFRLITATLLR